MHEVKHDGYRLIVRRDGETVRLFTRRGYDWTDRYPGIAVAAASCAPVVHPGRRGGGLRRGRRRRVRRPPPPRPVTDAMLYAFDLLELDGEDLSAAAARRAQGELARLLARAVGIVFNEHTDEDGAVVFRHACKMGLEGIVSKRLTAPYRSGPSRDWIKVKNPDSPAMIRAR